MPSDAVPGREDPPVADEGPSTVTTLDQTASIAVRKSRLKLKKEEKTPFKTKQTTICEISIKKFTEKIAKIKVSSCGGNRQENSFTYLLFSISSFLSNYSQQRTHLELVHLLTYFLTLKYKNCNFKVLTTNSTHMLECCIMT
jgi:hypothetical protein